MAITQLITAIVFDKAGLRVEGARWTLTSPSLPFFASGQTNRFGVLSYPRRYDPGQAQELVLTVAKDGYQTSRTRLVVKVLTAGALELACQAPILYTKPRKRFL